MRAAARRAARRAKSRVRARAHARTRDSPFILARPPLVLLARRARPRPSTEQCDEAVATAVEAAKGALTRKAHTRKAVFINTELAKARALNEGLKLAVDDAKLSASQGVGGMAADPGDSDGDGGGDASTFVGTLIGSLHTFAQERATSAFGKVKAAGDKAAESIAALERKAGAA